MYKDDNVVTVAYNWHTFEALIRSGFEWGNSDDTKFSQNFTTFIVKDRLSEIKRKNQSESRKVYDDAVERFSAPITLPLNEYVKWNGTDFTHIGEYFYPCGPNIYWLGFTEDHQYPTPERIEEIFKVTKRMSANTIRSHTLGFSTGSIMSMVPSLNTYNQNAWGPIDFSFWMARQYGIKLIVPLTDGYSWFHGNYGDFCKFRGVPKREFWGNKQVIEDFKAYIQHWLEHVNPYTGLAIKDDPSLFMIELGNELGNIRPKHDSITIPTKEWLSEISNFVKKIAPNHFVLDPTDEALGQSDNFNITSLDAHSAHFYEKDYGRLDKMARKAASVGKPFIVGEYSSHFGEDWFAHLEKNRNIKGSFFWSLYPHEDGTPNSKKVPHNDGFTLWYPEDQIQLKKLSNHFERLKFPKFHGTKRNKTMRFLRKLLSMNFE